MIADYMLVYTHPVWFAETLVEVALALWFMRAFKFRGKGLCRPVLATVAFLALWYAIQLLHVAVFAYDFLLCTLVMTLYAYASCSMRLRQAFYFSCIFVLCLEMGKIVSVDLIMQPFFDILVTISPLVLTVLWSGIMLVTAMGILALVSLWIFRWPIDYLTWQQVLLSLFPLIPYVYIRSLGYMFSPSDVRLYWDMVLVAILLGATTIAVVVANAQSMAAQARKVELAQMHNLLKEQHLQYVAQAEAAEALKRLRHDLKHIVSEGGADNVQPGSLAARINRELETVEQATETGNAVLDVILSQKKGDCLSRGIRPVFYADARDLSFLTSYELCAIFGNILDNAIEAAEHVPPDDVRTIALDVRRQSGMVAIQCRNPYGHELRRRGGTYLTTKGDAEDHGYGIKSVREIVEGHGGYVDIDVSGGVFVVTIVLPLPASEGERPVCGVRA